jgi:hypothetical protein
VTASDNLNVLQFPRLFHGSVSDLRGTHLVPGQFGGATLGEDPWKHHGQSRKHWVSASDSEDHAWSFAGKARAMQRGGRQRVYEVEPNADTKMGIEHEDHPVLKKAYAEGAWRKPDPAGEYVAPSFRVIAQHDIQPGAQGTFPSIDWSKHAKPGAIDDFNHPFGPRPQYERHENEAYRENRKRRMEAHRNPEPPPQKETLF